MMATFVDLNSIDTRINVDEICLTKVLENGNLQVILTSNTMLEIEDPTDIDLINTNTAP